jgi:aerotaxis receptor
MVRTRATPLTHERRFEIDELFFSTTDGKGVITSGNSVFARVSGWSEPELLGEPHSILRHPHMPRVVFKLLWEEIQAGRPIAAYVKNLARDGGYYWVIATVVPVDGGYLSVRFKPSSSFLGVVEDLYERLRGLEVAIESAGQPRTAAMEASGRALGEALTNHGFASYEDFMFTFVLTEMKSRDTQMGAERSAAAAATPRHLVDRTADSDLAQVRAQLEHVRAFLLRQFGHLDQFVAANEMLAKKSRFVIELAQDIRLVSQNVSISANRLESAGRPLAVVAQSIRELAESATTLVRKLTARIHTLSSSLRHLAFRISLGRLQAEMAVSFVTELQDASDHEGGLAVAHRAHHQKSITALTTCLASGLEAVFSVYAALDGDLRRTAEEVDALVDLLRTLHIVRLTGKVEVSRLNDANDLAALFDQVGTQLEAATTEMAEFADTIDTIRTTTRASMKEQQGVQTRLHAIDATVRRLAVVANERAE